MIQFACPHCQAVNEAAAGQAGGVVACRHCHRSMIVPSPASPPARPTPTPARPPVGSAGAGQPGGRARPQPQAAAAGPKTTPAAGTPAGAAPLPDWLGDVRKTEQAAPPPPAPARAPAPAKKPKSRKSRRPGRYYYAKDKQVHGPVASADLRQLAASGQLHATDWVWKEGKANWVPASSLTGLFPVANAPSPPAEANAPGQGVAAPPGGAAARAGAPDKGQVEQLIAGLTEDIRRDPKNLRAYLSRGRAYIEQGDYQKAVADYLEVLMLEPKNPRGFFQLAKACTKIGRLIESSAQAPAKG